MREITSREITSTCIPNTATLVKKQHVHKPSSTNHFDRLTDDLIIHIFSFLTTNQLCSSCARVCRRWYYLTWEPTLWQSLVISGPNCAHLNIDRALTTLLRLLSREFYCRGKSPSLSWDFNAHNTLSSTDTSITNSLNYSNLSLPIENIVLNGCSKLTDKSLILVARKCGSKLRSLEIRSCTAISSGETKPHFLLEEYLLRTCIKHPFLQLKNYSRYENNIIIFYFNYFYNRFK